MESEDRSPETTRRIEILPENGSFRVLKTNALTARRSRFRPRSHRRRRPVAGKVPRFGGRRQIVGDRVEQAAGADAVNRGAEGDGKDLASDDGLAQAGLELVFGQRALFKVAFHQLVVALGDAFDQLVAPFLDRVRELARGLRSFRLAVAVLGIAIGLAVDQVDDTLEVVLFADRYLERHGALAEVFLERREHELDVRVLTVHLVDVGT